MITNGVKWSARDILELVLVLVYDEYNTSGALERKIEDMFCAGQ